MPVKIGSIPGVLVTKCNVSLEPQFKRGYNQAINEQSEVCIGHNRERLARAISNHKSNSEGVFIPNKYDYELADAIISAESTLIERKDGK